MGYSPINLRVWKKITFKEASLFRNFWERNKKNLAYHAYFTQEKLPGLPFMVVANTQNVVALHIKIRPKANLILLPSLKEITNTIKKDFVNSIIELVTSLKSEPEILPDWTKNYYLPDELELRNQLLKLEAELKNLENQISRQKKYIADKERLKTLFVGAHNSLEEQVKFIFRELGVNIIPGGQGREDIILEFNGRMAIVEVKGATKSASENHAAQLEKWVAEYKSTHGTDIKGFLIVNTFRNLPLVERTETSFPHQMLQYSKNRNHCLFTTSQLLGLYLDVLTYPEKKTELINQLFETNGIFTLYDNWKDFLQYEDGS